VEDFGAIRNTILLALKALHFIVTEDQSGYWITANDGKRPMRWWVPPILGRRYLNATIKHFGIPQEWIDNPLSIPGEEDQLKPS
jgi:hypothetical protein